MRVGDIVVVRSDYCRYGGIHLAVGYDTTTMINVDDVCMVVMLIDDSDNTGHNATKHCLLTPAGIVGWTYHGDIFKVARRRRCK